MRDFCCVQCAQGKKVLFGPSRRKGVIRGRSLFAKIRGQSLFAKKLRTLEPPLRLVGAPPMNGLFGKGSGNKATRVGESYVTIVKKRLFKGGSKDVV